MATAVQFDGYKYLDINNYGLLPRIVYRINEGEWQIPEWDDENSRYVFHVTKGDIIQFKPDFSLEAHTPSESIRYIKSIYINPYSYNSNSNYSIEYNNIYNLTEEDIILILSTFNNGSYNSYIDYIYEKENFDNSIFELDENEQIIWNSYFIENYGDIYYPLVKQNILNKYHLIEGTTLYSYSWRFDTSRNIYTFDRFPNEGDIALIIDTGSTIPDIYYNYINSIEYKTNIYLNKKLFNFTTDTNCRFSASGNPLSLFYEYEYDFKKLAQINTKAMFMRLFAHCKGIVSCKNISLSPQLLSELCYYEMFLDCSNLKDSIKLKNIRKLGWACYAEMYAGCTSLEECGGLMAQKIASSCYANMFYGCSSLKEVPLICAETLKEESLKGTFSGCSSLRTIPNNFFHKTVPYRGYYKTFSGCEGIESINDLSFDEVGRESLYELFKGCTSIESIGNITINKVQGDYCMVGMFENCTSLESIGNIHIKKNNNSSNVLSSIFKDCSSLINTGYIKLDKLSSYCLSNAFENCTSLINYVNIIYTGEIEIDCFRSLYSGCINLETAPELLSTSPKAEAYQSMFNGCSKINYVKIDLIGYNGTSVTFNWLKDVSSTGDLISNSTCNWEIDNPSGVPEGWNLYYSDTIFLSKSTILSTNRSSTFTIKVNSLEDWRISSSIPSWVHFSKTSEIAGSTQITISIDANSNDNLYRDCDIIFSSENFNKNLHISQNVKNEYAQKYLTFDILSDGDLIIKRVLSTRGYAYNSSYIYIIYKINDEDWSDKIKIDYYNGTCSIPVVSGDKVNIKLINYDYYLYKYYYYSSSSWYEQYTSFEDSTCTFALSGNLFSFIEIETSLYGKYFLTDYSKYVSQYPAYEGGFKKLFMNCDALINIDNLYIEKDIRLGNSELANLFSNCYNLINIPTKFLPHNTLSSNCYQQMFMGCESLTTLPEDLLPAQTLTTSCYYGMFENCYGLVNIPENLLPATTLADSCYYRMFYNCELIENSPILPAETLVYACYYQMFYNCYSLSFIQCLATSIGDSSTYNWVKNVAEMGVFEKAPNMENWTIGVNGIPTNWILGGIVIYTTSYTINALGGTITLTGINTHNVTWNLVNNNSWLSSNISSGGKGNISITLSIDPNTTSSFKEAYIYITSTDLDEDIEIYIYQEAPEIIINKTTYNIGLAGKTINITGYSTYISSWNLVNNNSWIIDDISSSGSGEINFNLTISSSEEERTGVVYISCSGMTNDIPITINQIKSSYTIHLGNTYPWQIDNTQTGPNGETIYKSGNQGYSSTSSTMTIIIKDYFEFKLKVKSDGESSYDYLTISNLDTTSVKWSGSGNQGSWQDVPYSDISAGEHTITITYRKDPSVDYATDSGYFYIQEL